jgi:1,4-alpha-glucan branching enzyme
MVLKKGKKSCATKSKCATSKCSSKTMKAKKVKFAIVAPQARKVMVAGDFNNWEAKTSLKKGKTMWEKDLSLKPGKYEYKFVVDGNWINDPSNNSCVWNSFGTQNSVIEI